MDMVYDLTDVFVFGSVVVLSAFYLIFLLKYFMDDQQFFEEDFLAIESIKSFLHFVSDWALPAYFGMAFFATIYVIYKLTKEIDG